MYKNFPSDIKKFELDNNLFRLHKDGMVKSDFGMDNTPALLDDSFGLYSTVNVKKNIGPVKTEYFRISLTRTGTAHFHIGLEAYQTTRNFILFGIPGQIFSMHDISADFLAYYMLFTEKFISNNFLTLNRKQRFPFLTLSGLQCFELDEETAAEIENAIFRINAEIKGNKAECSEVIRLYIQLILVHANRNYRAVMLAKDHTSDTMQNLYHNYLKLVSRYYLTERQVTGYADMLYVSPDYLNRIVKSCSGKTAREFIDEMILMEAKAYLLHSTISVSEIAYKLEFADPSHFNRFFKKHCGLTPLEYRKQP